MTKKIITLLIAYSFACCTLLNAQHAIGSWQNHLSYHFTDEIPPKAYVVAPAGNIIYAIGNGGLFSYNQEDESVQTYWKNNFITDTDIEQIVYAKEFKTLLIIYKNANIDLLVNDKKVYNIPDYMTKNMSYGKHVNHITIHKEYAYLATSFGLLKLNIKEREISNSYILEKNIYSCTADDNYIYASTGEGLLKANLIDNLQDRENWTKVSDVVYDGVEIFQGQLIGNIISEGLFEIDRENFNKTKLKSGNYTDLKIYEEKLFCLNKNYQTIFNDVANKETTDLQLENIDALAYQKGVFWTIKKGFGLNAIKLNQNNKPEPIVTSIIPNSPKRNINHLLTFANEKLLVTGGGLTGNDKPGTIMMLKDNTWTSFQEEGIVEQTGGVSYRNITGIVEDPIKENHFFASSISQGLYEFKDGKFKAHYNHKDSLLEVAKPILPYPELYNDFVRVSHLAYDKNNILWMMNCEAEHTVHGLKPDPNGKLKPKDRWIKLNYKEAADITIFGQIVFDKRNWMWAVGTKYYNSSGLFCVDMNGTPENIKDDKHKLIRSYTNQDGVKLDYGTYCIAIDYNDDIWVGTDHGPLIIHNPGNFFNSNFYCTQVKVPRNDGTNLADFLLANDEIRTIAVDGANRKWLGTNKNGIYLLSPDGMETIHHFTTDNSPLISNSINSIAIHPETGEVFIGTDKGIISYQSDATEGETKFEDNEVYAYPNPVYADYNGVITVTGLLTDTDVKITNVRGKLVYQGTSVGGQFTWDGRNLQGNKVASGVYFVLATDAQGKQGVATKILIVNG